MHPSSRHSSRPIPLVTLALLAAMLACSLIPGRATPTVLPPTEAPSAQSSVRLSEIKNTVEASSSGGSAFATASDGQTVEAGGGVRTGSEARVRLDTQDASIVRLADGTTLDLTTIPASAADETNLFLEIGQIWALVSDAADGGAFTITTPEGTVSAERGSLVSVAYYPDTGRVLVTCLDGNCRLTGASGATTELIGSQQSEVPGKGQDPTGGSAMDGTQLTGWATEFPEAQPIVAEITPGAPASGPAPEANVTNGGGGFPLVVKLIFDGQGVLHLVWRSNKLRPEEDFFHMQLVPGGEWTAPEPITSAFGHLDIGPILVLDANGKLCMLFTGTPDLNDGSAWGTYHICQGDNGWAEFQRLDNEAGEFGAALAPDGTFKVLHYSRLNGVFFNGVLLSGGGATVLPQFAIDSVGTYHAAWVTLGSPFSVDQVTSTDGGATWSAPESISTGNEPNGLQLTIQADAGGDVHFAWDSGSELFYRRWSPDGLGDLQNLGGGSGASIAIDPAGLARVLYATNAQLGYAAQVQDGTFAPSVLFAGDGSQKPAIAVDGDGVAHAVWVQPDGDLYYTTIRPPG